MRPHEIEPSTLLSLQHEDSTFPTFFVDLLAGEFAPPLLTERRFSALRLRRTGELANAKMVNNENEAVAERERERGRQADLCLVRMAACILLWELRSFCNVQKEKVTIGMCRVFVCARARACREGVAILLPRVGSKPRSALECHLSSIMRGKKKKNAVGHSCRV